MKCYCCSVKKKMFESFVELETNEGKLYLCSKCNDLFYKIRDDVNDGNKKNYQNHCKELNDREKDSNESYLRWKNVFLANNRISED